jgi:type VI secretion system protein ImpC
VPFKILVAGDFSGKRDTAPSEPATIPTAPVPVNLDNFDQVLAGIAPAVEIDGMRFEFRALDDFHPDQLYRQTPRFREVRQAAAAAAAPVPAPLKSPSTKPGASLLDDIVEEEDGREAPVSVEDANDLQSFLKRATAGHVTAPEDQAARKRGDEAAGEFMRAVLHHPAVQALEKTWRSLDFLLRGVDATASVSLLDVTLRDFIKSLPALQEKLQKQSDWSLIVGDYGFGQGETDAAVLERIGSFAKALGATFLAGAYLPEDEGSEGWRALRASSLASNIGLVIPRFLLRLPYGKNTSSIDSFAFEEMPTSTHQNYRWGNGAFVAAFLIGSAYNSEDPQWKRRIQRRIDGLPLHIYQEDGESIAKPCAEIWMTEHDAETLLDAGLMPLASLKEQDGVLLVRFQSISNPAASLAVFSH